MTSPPEGAIPNPSIKAQPASWVKSDARPGVQIRPDVDAQLAACVKVRR